MNIENSKNPTFGWLSPKCIVGKTENYGLGVFAVEPIIEGDIVCVAGGYILTTEDEKWFSGEMADKPVEIEDDFYIGPRCDGDIDLCPHVRINHSCDPNVGIKGQILYVAMRPIALGDEVCIDYAMHMASNPRSKLVFTFKCHCGSSLCRGVFTEEDWSRSNLQLRYAGFFSSYVQQKIDRLQHGSCNEIGGVLVKTGKGRHDGFNWVDDRLRAASSHKGGFGLFARAPIPEGTIVFVQGGRVMSCADEESDDPIQITEDLVIGPLAHESTGSDRINHYCDPNCGFSGQIILATIRNVNAGEELCFDYAMCLSPTHGVSPYRMKCACGAQRCRQIITDTDYQLQELQERYLDYYSWHLKNRLTAEKHHCLFY